MILLAALLQGGTVADLDAELRAANSATAVIQKRCAVPIRAEVDRTAEKAASGQVKADLGAGEDTRLVYRLVRLTCGDVVYSRAENWYRPDRLTEAMNRALLSGDTPFGVVIKPLAPTRRTLATEFPDEKNAILRHRAVVLSGQGAPLAEVVETYTPALPLAAPPIR
ncbi:hypothetical protein [Sphingobium nicotianae]|uniref:Uncharacterized protein n=1 Tax=Sphingobium nicotianae TaxID=2782607 RepID=A0A9X1AJZ6_9SPHN|nr:hypothetical protein [Sphingobium nicotianae]MBT2185625.1 hypothetical protein [Sphingobium nicotianae]